MTDRGTAKGVRDAAKYMVSRFLNTTHDPVETVARPRVCVLNRKYRIRANDLNMVLSRRFPPKTARCINKNQIDKDEWDSGGILSA